jgi:NHLM bacteriocin system ABC transporter ATP-binding protein
MNHRIFGKVGETTSRLAPAPDTGCIAIDARQPHVLDHRDHVFRVAKGHVDVFAVDSSVEGAIGARHYLFRIECGDVLLDLDQPESPTRIIAVGGLDTEISVIPRAAFQSFDLVEKWIVQLAQLIAGPNPDWNMREVTNEPELAFGERRRGPARSIVWVSLTSGAARLMGLDPSIAGKSPPLPLTSGMWIEASPSSCAVVTDLNFPEPETVWRALDQFHRCIGPCLRDHLSDRSDRETERIARRSEIMRSENLESFDRLAAIVVSRFEQTKVKANSTDPLFYACQIVADAVDVPIDAGRHLLSSRQDFAEVVEIARAAGLRVRQTLLRGAWWNEDVGPLVSWHGEQRDPVALIRNSSGRYTMIKAATGERRVVDRSLAEELVLEAVTFYPPLPSRAIAYRDLLVFSLRHSRGSIYRIALAVITIGLLSLVAPLITEVLINSVIPRTEIDQLLFCAFALAAAAIGMSGVQAMEGLAMLRLEGLIDWRLQAAIIDRMLRLPASLFRDYTVGDFVGRSMGIAAARRIFTGRVLRGMMAGLFGWVSVGLMFYYDMKLALIALLLTIVRAVVIIFVSAVRLYQESKYFNLQGKTGGFVLQLISGIGKLRVAAATIRALAVWSRQFVDQRQHFMASQQASNALGVFETSFPLIATMIIFAVATSNKSALLQNVGGFLAFLTAFGQSMGAIGAWASSVSEGLIAIPQLARLKPLMSSVAEVSKERKPPGDLSGAVEFSRLTFRYVPHGPPVLDNVSLRIAPGEYVAIVGPSGSGKSSLFRLLLGFEKAESGAVFFDGKAIDTLDISAVRRQLGVVLQNGTLATGSIYENICGGVQLPLEQAWEAARLAGLEDDINAMPMGMHTVVSEGLSTLSGGQRQRVMIARAVARRPRILLFDEATSALDNQSQAIVSRTLGNLNVTRIVIAHRLSTVRQVDRIIVVVDGKIVQSGSFAELNSTPGMFASFSQRQLL